MTNEEKVTAETLRLGYTEICRSYHTVREMQLKLLALIPVIMGVAVSLLMNREVVPSQFYVMGGLGICLTMGLYIYGLRADQHASALIKRGEVLENELKLPIGQFKNRPTPRLGILGYTLALTLIYLALLSAWAFVIYRGWRVR